MENRFLMSLKKSKVLYLSFASLVVILLGIIVFFYNDNKKETVDLGTFENPEIALKETRMALALLSTHINNGIESVKYIDEYETAKNKIFIVD